MENQYHFLTPVPIYESLVPKRFSAYSVTNFTHSIGRRPRKVFEKKLKSISEKI